MATIEHATKPEDNRNAQGESCSRSEPAEQKAQTSAQGAGGSVTDQSWQLASRAKDEVKDYLGSRKEGIATMLSDVAEATRKAAGFLGDRSDSSAARYVNSAANRADQLSDYVRNHEPTDLINDVKQAARRNPAVICGGLFAVGLLMSRFLRSSEPGTRPQ